MTFVEINVWDFAAVATVPAERRSAKALRRFVAEQEDELERLY